VCIIERPRPVCVPRTGTSQLIGVSCQTHHSPYDAVIGIARTPSYALRHRNGGQPAANQPTRRQRLKRSRPSAPRRAATLPSIANSKVSVRRLRRCEVALAGNRSRPNAAGDSSAWSRNQSEDLIYIRVCIGIQMGARVAKKIWKSCGVAMPNFVGSSRQQGESMAKRRNRRGFLVGEAGITSHLQ